MPFAKAGYWRVGGARLLPLDHRMSEHEDAMRQLVIAAMPPDVRRWLCPAVRGLLELGGYAPGAEPHSFSATLAEGRSHFRTSGGEAAAGTLLFIGSSWQT